jgi:TonB family protein
MSIKHAVAICLLSIASISTARASTLPAATWRSAVDQNAASLQRADYNNSLKSAERILSQMVARLGAGSAEDEILATVITQKALANAGLGKIDQALWDWYVAQEISPAIGRSDLSAFGAPGDFLKRHPFASSEGFAGGATSPARVLKQVLPEFPTGASHLATGYLMVRIVVDRNGQPTLPRIVHPLPAATLSFAALEALKHWQFQPAKRNGEAVATPFDLTVHYKL